MLKNPNPVFFFFFFPCITQPLHSSFLSFSEPLEVSVVLINAGAFGFWVFHNKPLLNGTHRMLRRYADSWLWQFTLNNAMAMCTPPCHFLVGYPLILGARSHSHTDSICHLLYSCSKLESHSYYVCVKSLDWGFIPTVGKHFLFSSWEALFSVFMPFLPAYLAGLWYYFNDSSFSPWFSWSLFWT